MNVENKIFQINRILLGALAVSLLPNILMFFCNELVKTFVIVIFYLFFPIIIFIFIEDILERLSEIKTQKTFNIFLFVCLLVFNITMLSLSIYNVFIPIISNC